MEWTTGRESQRN